MSMDKKEKQDIIHNILRNAMNTIHEQTGELAVGAVLAVQFAQDSCASFTVAKIPVPMAMKVLDLLDTSLRAEIRAAKVKMNTIKQA
jgi:hypothetical protein